MTIIMSALVRVSAVSYLNTAPFVYGLQHSLFKHSFNLSLDYPAECSRKLLENEVDVGLVPVASLLHLPEYYILSNYCLGTNGNVRTVSLLSNSPLDNVSTIYLDFQSRSSNLLVQILAKQFWKKDFSWEKPDRTLQPSEVKVDEAIIAIGDKVFANEDSYKYNIDLASEWGKYTSLPFVFAVWAANKRLPAEFEGNFNQALKLGLGSIDESIKSYNLGKLTKEEALFYLTHNISYNLDERKREALNLFLRLGKSISPG